MRFLFAAAVLALALAPVAGAEFGPPLASVPSTLKTLQIVYLKDAQDRAPSSCSVHARRSPGAVGKVERKLALSPASSRRGRSWSTPRTASSSATKEVAAERPRPGRRARPLRRRGRARRSGSEPRRSRARREGARAASACSVASTRPCRRSTIRSVMRPIRSTTLPPFSSMTSSRRGPRTRTPRTPSRRTTAPGTRTTTTIPTCMRIETPAPASRRVASSTSSS